MLDFDTPSVPPATPPVINDRANPEDAALADPSGDSDFPGRTPDERVHPGGDTYDPAIPAKEVPPGEEQLDRPSDTPDEAPAPDPAVRETPPPD